MKQKQILKQLSKNISKRTLKQISKQTYYLIAGLLVFCCLVFFNVYEQAGQTSQTSQSFRTPTGYFSMVEIAPKSFVYQEPEDTSPEAAKSSLEQAEKDIEEMKKMNFVSVFANDALSEARNSYLKQNYSHVFKLTQLVAHTKRQKIEFYDKLKLMEVKKQVLQEKGVSNAKIKDVNALIQQAMTSFTLDQLDEADNYLSEANQELTDLAKEESRLQLLALLSKNFFIRYWWQSLIFLILAISGGIYSTRKIRIHRLKTKISRMKLDLEKTKELIKNMQKECFISKIISVKTYKDRAEKFEESITEIKHTLPLLEEQLKKMKREKVGKK